MRKVIDNRESDTMFEPVYVEAWENNGLPENTSISWGTMVAPATPEEYRQEWNAWGRLCRTYEKG